MVDFTKSQKAKQSPNTEWLVKDGENTPAIWIQGNKFEDLAVASRSASICYHSIKTSDMIEPLGCLPTVFLICDNSLLNQFFFIFIYERKPVIFNILEWLFYFFIRKNATWFESPWEHLLFLEFLIISLILRNCRMDLYKLYFLCHNFEEVKGIYTGFVRSVVFRNIFLLVRCP